MLWVLLMLLSWGLALLLVHRPSINKLWPAGLAAVAVTLILDVNLVELGAFRFKNTLYDFRGVPLFYIISNFANGLLLARFVPTDGVLKPVVTVGLAAVFLALELLAVNLGYFQYLNWSPLHSLGLNVLGFIAVLWGVDLLHLRRQYNQWP
ncbi:hypothetical protein JOC37_001143 [Desulfohalotomaculum tongense]|uniref:hypothetical protein n=1 Tax=Desulforadius tongensis TaxID=1216062 RepID=UPI00195E2E5C|nr:hypothetical protein [Desulforadius tongensis]MBM7854765.1 hypothetical protein [Desulforadius tongensis]